MKDPDVIIVGAGVVGSIIARELAEAGSKVLILEKRSHIAGCAYDEKDASGILYHKYGPHILHFEDWHNFDYLSKYTEFVPYQHYVTAEIDGKEVPLPFNLNSIDKLFEVHEAIELKDLLIKTYGLESKVPILKLRTAENPKIRSLADFIYEKVFLHYTMKMWGISPEEIDPSIIGHVPVRISYDNRHFISPIQVMPKEGFTKLFQNLLNHRNITVKLNTDALSCMKLKEGEVFYNGKVFSGKIIYTGRVDELLGLKYGELPYRSLYFEHNVYKVNRLQTTAVLNFPDDRPEMRRTEHKLLVCQPNVPGVTSTTTEYPGEYNRNSSKWNEPYYPIITEESKEIYDKYVKEISEYSNIVLVGRLAQFKYYEMGQAIDAAFAKLKEII
jgi:UDP-galactopyranose mutase